ncbi:MAG: hypothetical protein AB1610_03280 [Nitrospirota bacterium]
MIYTDIFGNSIELTDERWVHIVKEHPEIKQYKDKIQMVLGSPDYVKKSSRDADVLLYYKFYSDIFAGKYVLIAVKKGLRSFILTCYITDTIKKGATLWERK